MSSPDPAQDDVLIRPLEAADAEALRRCFEYCYGGTYVEASFYDPSEIRSRLADGRLRSVVAVNSAGEIVGHMGLTRRSGDAVTADAGNTVVDPRYRNQKLAARIGARLFGVCRDAGLIGFHHYPTTAHPIMQKLALVLSFALLSGAVGAQAASYTYINQQTPYQNPNPPMLTALNLPKIGTTFKVQVPASCNSCFWGGLSAWLAFGVGNPALPIPAMHGYLFTTAEIVIPTTVSGCCNRTGNGTVTMSFPIPNMASWLGVRFFQQVDAYHYGGPNFHFLSRGGVGVIGR